MSRRRSSSSSSRRSRSPSDEYSFRSPPPLLSPPPPLLSPTTSPLSPPTTSPLSEDSVNMIEEKGPGRQVGPMWIPDISNRIEYSFPSYVYLDDAMDLLVEYYKELRETIDKIKHLELLIYLLLGETYDEESEYTPEIIHLGSLALYDPLRFLIFVDELISRVATEAFRFHKLDQSSQLDIIPYDDLVKLYQDLTHAYFILTGIYLEFVDLYIPRDGNTILVDDPDFTSYLILYGKTSPELALLFEYSHRFKIVSRETDNLDLLESMLFSNVIHDRKRVRRILINFMDIPGVREYVEETLQFNSMHSRNVWQMKIELLYILITARRLQYITIQTS